MNQEIINQIQNRLDKITSGTWVHDGHEIVCNVSHENHLWIEPIVDYVYALDDAEFIAHAPDDIYFLLETIKELLQNEK